MRQRKIIHIDMDCFYAAIEVRDNPSLRGKPVAVGGPVNSRGVLCTCNYEARKYGVHSAMPSSQAARLCPDLIIVPVNFDKYRAASKQIHEIFTQYTQLIEPLSLDEAYLDVSDSDLFSGSATYIAQDIRNKIYDSQKITASAGIAPNKLLAKIASDWRKPNGQFVIKPDMIEEFLKDLPVKKLFGVGKVTAKKLEELNIITCADLQQHTQAELLNKFGSYGQHLYEMSRGIDNRDVVTERVRKSLSVERTFSEDYAPSTVAEIIFEELFLELRLRLKKANKDFHKDVKNVHVKIKFNDFSSSTIQSPSKDFSIETFKQLFMIRSQEINKPIRLIGFGVHFHTPKSTELYKQLSFNFSQTEKQPKNKTL